MKPFQLIGGTRWFDEDKFQVLAKGEESATPDQVRLMSARKITGRTLDLGIRYDFESLPAAVQQNRGNFSPRLVASNAEEIATGPT